MSLNDVTAFNVDLRVAIGLPTFGRVKNDDRCVIVDAGWGHDVRFISGLM